MMKFHRHTAAAIMALAGFGVTNANASIINVGGVFFDPDDFFDFTAKSAMYETTAFQAGDIISGYGKMTTLNGETDPSIFCPSCELTYEFGEYTLLDLNPADPNTGIGTNGNFAFTGGWLKIYADPSKNFDPLMKATAGNGTLWLDLLAASGSYPPGITLFGSATGPNSIGLSGGGVGYFDVVGGLASGHFNTNSEPGGSDLTYTSEFQPLRNPIINGLVTVATHGGSNTMYGTAIPEPTSLSLLGLGLLGMGLHFRNKKAA